MRRSSLDALFDIGLWYLLLIGIILLHSAEKLGQEQSASAAISSVQLVFC